MKKTLENLENTIIAQAAWGEIDKEDAIKLLSALVRLKVELT